MSQACGIDFGTSNSTVGWHANGQSSLLALEQDKATLPSVVFFNHEEDEITYGRTALSTYLSGYEGRLMRSMKSLLGTPLIEGQTEVMGRTLAFRDLLSGFIGELKKRAEQSAGQTFSKAVFGRPVHFIDDDSAADQLAQNTLEHIAKAVGFKEVQFQFEPIAAALDYETSIEREELVLIVDIGGGTSDFSLVRLSPERSIQADRQADILGNGGVHIGGTDFDKYLSLGQVMPMLGLGGKLANGVDMPSSYYFNLATWHTINQLYTKKVTRELQDIYREVSDSHLRTAIERLLNLVDQRDGHWLAQQTEEAKILLTSQDIITLTLDRLRSKSSSEGDCILQLTSADFAAATAHLIDQIENAVKHTLGMAGVAIAEVDTVFFTGGSSSVRGLRQRIAALVPDAKHIDGDLFGSIGRGLGLDAARRFT